jgi:acyl-CoA reductase-like NAD-dependent aldehyde dehydrogenase
VHENIYDEFVSKLKAKVDAMKMGNPLDETTDMGTVVSKSQYDKIKQYIDIGSKEPVRRLLESILTKTRLYWRFYCTLVADDHRSPATRVQ